MRAAVVLCCVAVLAAGCQPAGGPGAGGSEFPSDGSTARPLGAPAAGAPSSLDELLTRGLKRAEEWQDEPVLAEVEVDVTEAGAWTGSRVTYLAADADRMLQLVASGGGFTQELPSLASLGIQPVPEAGLDELPEFPEDAATPQTLAVSEAAQACDVKGDVTVLYVTGAPVAWDGVQWATPPEWRVTVTGADGAGAQLDIAGAAAGDCLEPAPASPPAPIPTSSEP